MLMESGGKGNQAGEQPGRQRSVDDLPSQDEDGPPHATPIRSFNPQGQGAGFAESIASNAPPPSFWTPSLKPGAHASSYSPEANPKRKLLFPPTPPAFLSPSGAPSPNPPVRTGSPPQASHSPGVKRPPLPPQVCPPPRTQSNGAQAPAMPRLDRTVSLDPSVKTSLQQEVLGGTVPSLKGRRHSWDPSIDPPQSRRTSSADLESPLSRGIPLAGRSNPLRRASTVSPDLSPTLRSLATRSSPLGSEGSSYTPASALKIRKTSWSGEDFSRSLNQEISSERRSSLPAHSFSPDCATSSGRIKRGRSGDAELKEGDEESPQVKIHGAELSPKTEQARQVRSLRNARVRWRLTTCLGGFVILLLLTSLLTHFWALSILPPQFETKPEAVHETAEEGPVRCVRNAKGGEVACYVPVKERHVQERLKSEKRTRAHLMFGRLLAMAAHSLAELDLKADTQSPWFESPAVVGTWVACADEREPTWRPPPSEKDANGYLVLSAEGGLNQQRIAVCNAVAIARQLNLTLVLPTLVQGGTSEASLFADLFDVDHFKESLRLDVLIVDRLPDALSQVDLAASGSMFDDKAFPREAPLRLYEETLLPAVKANRVVHLRQFVNRLAFDPIPPHIQRLRCRVNFHALRFQPAIQAMGDLLIDRMRARSVDFDRYRSRKGSQSMLAGSKEALSNRRLLQVHGDVNSTSFEVLDDGKEAGFFDISRDEVHLGDKSLLRVTERRLLQTELEARGLSAEQLLEERQRHMRSQSLRDGGKKGAGEIAASLSKKAGTRKESSGDVSQWESSSANSGGGLEVPVRFVALHANLPAQLAAYSMCDFGGAETEREELRRVREAHFETLARWERKGKAPDPLTQRKTGQCPLTPEEAVLMLAALEVKRRTRIYLTTAEMWGGHKRLTPLRLLYPYFVTKEQLASPEELAPFAGSLHKLAALDLIVSSSADLFALTDPGSQLSSLVTGGRIYRGRGKLPTIWPDKRKLAAALADHKDVEWHVFAKRVGDSIRSFLEPTARREGESIYRRPRSQGCMRFEVAAPAVTTTNVDRIRDDDRGTRDAEDIDDRSGGQGGDTEEEILAIDFSARNGTSVNGTDTFGLFKASQRAAEESLQGVSSSSDLERD